MNPKLARIIAVVAALALVAAAPAAGKRKVERAGNLYIGDNGGISPTKLPRHGTAPVTAHIEGEIGTVDGSHPPALRSLELDVDRTIVIDAVGLPRCAVGKVRARTTAAAKHACPDAIVGEGRAEVDVAFPESAPFSASGPLVLFNGGVQGGTTVVILHAYVAVPVPTAIVVRAAVTRIHKGRFGLQVAARIPPIAGSAGSVTEFRLKIGRRFIDRGRRRSFLAAGCPTGIWATKGRVVFDDETELGLTHVFPCVPEG